MRRSLLILSLFALGACSDMGGANPLDAQKFLASLDGPKVPTMQDTQMETAKDAEKKGDYKQASGIYQQILDKHPDDKDAAFGLAESARRMGDNDNAIIIYDNLLKKDPTMVAAKEGKGLALMAKGDFDTPAAIFEDVLKTDPNRWKTLNALGILFTTRSMQPEAQQYFAEALRHSPSNPSILNNMGLSQALGRQYEAAIDSLKQASALTVAGTNERKRVDLNLALVYAIAGKLEEADAIAQSYYTGAILDNNMGLYAHLAKDDQLAKTYLNMALSDSKVFYEKAWNNLQNIDGTSKATPADAAGGPVVLNGDTATSVPPSGNSSSKSKMKSSSDY